MNSSLLWHAFTPDTDEMTIIAAFSRRWGCAPETIIRERTLTLAGPVPQQDALGDAMTPEPEPDIAADLLADDVLDDADPRTAEDWEVPGV